ncbi:MAG: hypothetical protein ABJH52_09370 [Henriciella sp.]
MRQSVFEYIDNLDTLLAVVVGALLATGGAMVAELVQDRLGRKRKEREAARFFGEILTTVDRILDFAFASIERGERWGNVSLRLFKTALNETAVYERNRERLFEVGDFELRQVIHSHFLIETIPLAALIEHWEEIKALEKEISDSEQLSETRRNNLNAELEALTEARQAALDSIREAHAKTEAICETLEPFAGMKFPSHAPPV